MTSVNRITQSNAGWGLSVPFVNVLATMQHQLRLLGGGFQSLINRVAPTGYEDNAGFHLGIAPKNTHQAGGSDNGRQNGW